jgi:hypothetical protein
MDAHSVAKESGGLRVAFHTKPFQAQNEWLRANARTKLNAFIDDCRPGQNRAGRRVRP